MNCKMIKVVDLITAGHADDSLNINPALLKNPNQPNSNFMFYNAILLENYEPHFVVYLKDAYKTYYDGIIVKDDITEKEIFKLQELRKGFGHLELLVVFRDSNGDLGSKCHRLEDIMAVDKYMRCVNTLDHYIKTRDIVFDSRLLPNNIQQRSVYDSYQNVIYSVKNIYSVQIEMYNRNNLQFITPKNAFNDPERYYMICILNDDIIEEE